MTGVCSKCRVSCAYKEGKPEPFGFPCDICRTVLCRKCADWSSTEVRFIALANRVVPYVCGECIVLIRQMPVLGKKIEVLEGEVLALKEASGQERQSYADILKKNRESAKVIEGSLKHLEEKVEVLSKSEPLESNSASNLQLEPTILELKEREQRSTNVLIFGVVEPVKSDREERISHENETVETILKQINDDIKSTSLKIRRIGKYEEGKIRPIRVTFSTAAEALQTLKHRAKLAGMEGVYIKSDQTVAQCNYLKALLTELEVRKKNGEDNLRVRYINSVPKIIKIDRASVKKTKKLSGDWCLLVCQHVFTDQ